MEVSLLIGRLALACVFAVSGVAKLADRDGARQAVENFGLPRALSKPLALALLLAELATAVALVPTTTARWGALAASLLLLLFVVAIGVNLVRGHRPDCRCFGQLHSAPVGWSTVARNLVLAGLAAMVVWQGPGSGAAIWASELGRSDVLVLSFAVVLIGLVAVQGWVVLNLLRRHGHLLVRIDALEALVRQNGTGAAAGSGTPAGLPVGAPAPGFRLQGVHGETSTLEALGARGAPVLLVFTDPACGPCTSLLPELSQRQSEIAAGLTIALISRGALESNRAKANEHGLANVLVQERDEVADAYQLRGTPGAVLVDSEGRVASPAMTGADAVRSLLSRAVGGPGPIAVAMGPVGGNGNGNGHQPHHHHSEPAGPSIGETAPAFSLPDLDGRPVELAEFRGSDVLLAFWNPACGFCGKMLPELKAWEADPPEGAPKLVLVSTGSVGDNRAMELRSTVLFDQASETMHAFGANGTPMAVLVDAEGKIASSLAVGASGVLALASGEGNQSNSPEAERGEERSSHG